MKKVAQSHQNILPVLPRRLSNGLPIHVGFIPDGNRRWAFEHGLLCLKSHVRL